MAARSAGQHDCQGMGARKVPLLPIREMASRGAIRPSQARVRLGQDGGQIKPHPIAHEEDDGDGDYYSCNRTPLSIKALAGLAVEKR